MEFILSPPKNLMQCNVSSDQSIIVTCEWLFWMIISCVLILDIVTIYSDYCYKIAYETDAFNQRKN